MEVGVGPVRVHDQRKLLDEAAVPPLGLPLSLEEPRVLDSRRRLLGEADEEVQLRLSEGAPGTEAPHGRHADHLVSREQRRDHEPLLRLHLRAGNRARTRIVGDVVYDLGLAAGREPADDPLSHDDAVRLDLVGVPAQRHGRSKRPVLRLHQVDGAGVGLEQVLRPLGDALQHTGHVDRRRELSADLGQRGHLVGPATRLLVELRVLDRDADIGGDRGEEAHVGLAETALVGGALHADDADRRLPRHDRHAEVRLRGDAETSRPNLLEVLRSVEQERCARLEDARRQPLPEGDRRRGDPSCRARCSRGSR